MNGPIHEASAREIRDAVRGGECSAEEITQSTLDRIAAVDPSIGAFIEVWNDAALEQARTVDAIIARGEDPGPLAGVPIGLKDLLCTREGTTNCCSQILKGFQSVYDGTAVERLRDSGAVFLGKLNMDEFAMGSSTENSSFQKTRNPWDTGRVPGGSSGGSAAAIAADLCPITLGSDTGGSIRQPAAFCGVVGIKPTYGRVSRYGLIAFASSLDQIGSFSRTVADSAETLNIICGRDLRDATSADLPVPDFTEGLEGGVKGLRIGLPKEYFTDALNEDVRDSVMKAIGVLEAQGAETVEVSLPHTKYAIATYYIICTAEASSNLARFDGVRYGNRPATVTDMEAMYRETKSQGFGPEVQRRILLGTYVLSSGYYDAYYLKGQKVRRFIRDDFVKAYEQCDVIATPTAPSAAFAFGAKSDDPLEMYLNDIYTSSANLAGIPGISVPCGFVDGGLPVGLQLLGKDFDEATILRAAHTYEANRGFDLGRPAIAAASEG